jgi:FkbM family methyltransferase
MSPRNALVALVLAAAGAMAAGHFYPPVRLFAMAAVGRGTGCPMRKALAADENLQLQIVLKDRILHASRLVEDDPAGYHLIETPRGRWWIPAGDDFGLPFNLAEQAREIYGGGDRAVRPGDVALDCGANVGVWTRTALDRGARLVVAFEPAPENIESYRRNYKAEIAAGRVILVPKGVWNKDDVLLLRRDPRNSAADTFVMTLKGGAQAVQAPLTTIDKVVAELKLERVDFIKMDVEGAETKALAGARNTIAKFHPRMSIAAEHLPTDAEAIPEAVKAAWPGYAVECGPCVETKDGHVRPDVLYFK